MLLRGTQNNYMSDKSHVINIIINIELSKEDRCRVRHCHVYGQTNKQHMPVSFQYHQSNIAQISKHLSFCHRETLIHAFVTSKIAQYNILLSGLRQDQVRKLQYVQNSAARLLTSSCKHEHITPVLRNLHWLPVHESIGFKILLMTFKCLNELAPSYLSDLLIHYRPLRTLRSSDKELLVQLRCHLKTYGERAFPFIAPKLWNALPLSIKRCKSVESFKPTYLFKDCFEL